MKSPCLVSFSVTNCFASKRLDRDLDDEDHRGRGGESIFSCGCARIGCLTPSWLNPQPVHGGDDETERQRREQQVETSINILKARQAQQAVVKQVKAKREKKKKKISAPHLETFRRTTDDFINAHLAMCPDPRARVTKYDNEECSSVRVVSLEASAPPPPSTDEAAPSTLRPLPPTPAADARGRLPAALPTPNHLPPPPLPPATSSM